MSKVIVIIGAGAGIAHAVAEKFGHNGFSVILIARKKDKLKILTQSLIDAGIDAHYYIGNAGDSDSMKDAFEQIWENFNHVDVVHYNAAKLKNVNIASESADALTRDFKVNVAGVMTAVNLVLPDMEKKGEGTILLTGGGFALAPNPDYGSLAIGKAGLRSLADSLHQALKPKNIFVGTVTVCGYVSPEAEKHTPKNIADQFWKLHTDKNEFEIQF
jgi:NADP-dependent 3-hydroxy acid dehydrogenase YdfG